MADLYRYWRDSPPTHELVAGYLGVKPQAELTNWRPPAGMMSFAEMQAQFAAATKIGGI